ncbi:phosphatase PAP2 family protein [Cupriavidus sp. IDO]|uniref:phosphatase PAP2 family protein n=1 Tax=Cupriavidus sp. IDO TaxID=1539142 RepID=UPI0009E33B46|nr:phosphatase PAP2 family protein [Cupriavidus sp. IDO]
MRDMAMAQVEHGASLVGADWLTPGALLTVLSLFTLVLLFLLCLVPLLVFVLRPLIRRLDGWRVARLSAMTSRTGTSRLWAATSWTLQRNVAELLLVMLAGALLLACGGVLVWLIGEINEGSMLVLLDQAVFAQLQAWRQGWLDAVMVAVTELGGGRISVAVGVVVFAWLMWRRAWAAAVYWAGALLGARACVMVLKLSLQRVRPASIYTGLESYSFPSGHATSSMVTYGFLAFLLCVRQPWRVRIPVLALTAMAVVCIGLSRLYLGMHWLSDVAAGVALGLAWVVMLGTAYRTLHVPARLPALPLGAVAAATVLVVGSYLAWFSLPDRIARYRQAGASVMPAPGAARPASPAEAAKPAAGRSCGDRCPALQSDSPPR